MDATTEFLSDYASRLTCADLSSDAIRQVRRTVVTDEEVERKFRSLAAGALGETGCDRVLAAVRDLEHGATLDGLFESLIPPGA